MTRVIALLTGLSVVLYSGCTTLTMTRNYTELEPQLKQWESDHEYGRTLNALGQIDPKDPDYASAADRRKQVEKKAAEYEQQVRRETYQKRKKGDWAGALDQYDEALNKYSKSAVIKDGLAKLHQQQRLTLNELELKRLIHHGEWLAGAIPVYQDIARVDPRSSTAQNRLKRIQGEAEEIAQELAIIGNKALADNELEKAEATLPLALQLYDDPVIEESLNSLRARQKTIRTVQKKARLEKEQLINSKKKKQQRTIAALEKRYKQAFAKEDFITAGKQLSAIEKINHEYSKLASMKGTLQKAVDKKVTQLFERGVSAYSRGLFEQAASEWRSVLKLDPNHQQAKENLQRAEKVLEKIERLKQKQGG